MTGRPGPARRVLVTGAAGFLGRHAVAALLGAGWEVEALVHARGLPERLRAGGVRVRRGDVTRLSTVRAATARVDAVLHLAAYVPPDQGDPAHAAACLQTNALATLQLARCALERPGCRFVYASAGNAYADARGAAAEGRPLYPAARATYYLASKVAGELFVEHLRRARGLPAVSLRVSTPYGAGMPERSVVARFMACALQGLPLDVWDGGAPRYDYVYAADVVGLAVAALGGGTPGVYNAGSGAARSVLELAQAVADTFPDRRVPIEVIPARGPVPASFPALVVARAARRWGYRPRDLRAGLAAYREALEREPPEGQPDDRGRPE